MRRQSGLKLKKSPLVLVLCQVRFPAVLKMSQYVPDIQESLRHAKLTKYVEEQTEQLTLGPEIRTESERRWLFANRNQREAALLTRDFVVYETTSYDVFETFVSRFREILEVVKTQVGIEYAEQVGLRYVDLIRPTADRPASSFLRESLRGLSSDELGVTGARHQFLMQAKTPHGTLSLKSFENSGSRFLPPDLDATHLKFDVEPSADETFRIIDFDHIFRGDVEFSADDLSDKLWALHDLSSKTFQCSVTPEAIEYWKGQGA
jgi:uncharacterized protein (TIGR04255 family)